MSFTDAGKAAARCMIENKLKQTKANDDTVERLENDAQQDETLVYDLHNLEMKNLHVKTKGQTHLISLSASPWENTPNQQGLLSCRILGCGSPPKKISTNK